MRIRLIPPGDADVVDEDVDVAVAGLFGPRSQVAGVPPPASVWVTTSPARC
jgi:hypothetical protein